MANIKDTFVLVKYLGEQKTLVRIEKGGEKESVKKGSKFKMDILGAIKLARASKNFEILSADAKVSGGDSELAKENAELIKKNAELIEKNNKLIEASIEKEEAK